MILPKSLTTVTKFSKFLALLLFIFLPLASFYLGAQYQKSVTPQFDFENWQKLQSIKQKAIQKPTPTPDKTITLTGTVKKLTPVDPNDPVEYKYSLKLDEPFNDPLQANGNPIVTEVSLIGVNNEINEDIKNNIGKKITAAGTIEWGYAESRYFLIKNITP